MFRKKKILISGGAGFIGSHLAAALVADDNEVWCLGRQPELGAFSDIKYRVLDIRNFDCWDILEQEQFDYVFHLAGNADQNLALQDPRYDLEENFLATFNLLEKIRTMVVQPKLIFASSVTVYGNCSDLVLHEETSVTVPIGNYGVSKLAAERYVYAYAKQYKIKALTARIFSTYGPGLRRQIVFDLIKKLSKDPTQLEILGTGNEARDLIYIDDQVNNLLTIAKRGKYEGEVYNAACGRLTTTRQIAEAVSVAMNLKPKFIFTEQIRIFDAPTWLADVSKITVLGCKPRIDLIEGASRTVAWFKNNFSV